MTLLCKTVTVCAILILPCFGQELISNPDFEDPLEGDDWVCTGCTLTQDDTDPYQGTYAGMVTERCAYALIVLLIIIALLLQNLYYLESKLYLKIRRRNRYLQCFFFTSAI